MANEHYKVSLFIPVYNVEKYIERCARSVFEQTYDQLEYIFVDDCSPDNSMDLLSQVLNDYPQRKEQVKMVHNKERKGIAAVRNSVKELVTGNFFVYVDSDDWIDRDTVEKLVKKQIATGADIVSCDGITEGDRNKDTFDVPSITDPHQMILSLLSSAHSHQVWGKLIRTSLFRKIDGAKPGLDNGEDTLILSQLLYYSTSLANVHEPLYHYFLGNKTSLTHIGNVDKVNKKARIQIIQNCIILRNFFKGKDETLEKKANWHVAFRIWDSLKHCARRDKNAFYEILSYRKYLEGNPFLSLAGRWGRLGVFWRTHYYCLSFIR